MLNKIKSNVGIIILICVSVIMVAFFVFASPVADVPIYIKNVDDFKKIEDDMSARYIITGYLTFENWVPLGSEEEPFTGTLEARNPITIKSFDATSSNNVGLFAVNEGTITGVEVYNSFIDVTLSNNSNYGIYAGINRGSITKCTIWSGRQEIVAGDGCNIGIYAGKNYGTIDTCLTTIHTAISHEGSLVVGGLAGFSDDANYVYNTMNSTIEARDGSKVIGGGITGISSNSTFTNNLVGSSFRSYVSEDESLGGFIGRSENGNNVISNCYNRMNIQIYGEASNSYCSLGVGKIENNNFDKFENVVVSGFITSATSKNCISGVYYSDENVPELNVTNCYYTSDTIYGSKYEQGVFTTYAELSLDKLHWDETIWHIDSEGIECLIYYEI